MQLLLYETGKLVFAYDVSINMCCAFYFTKTFMTSTITGERLRHIPFGRRIEECHFISFINWAKRNDLHRVGVKKNIRIATMINILQMLGLQHNMLVNINLHR